MNRKLVIIAISVIFAGGALSAVGCSSSNDKPYALTGTEIHKTQGEINREAADQKYRATPGWRQGVQVPANYPAP